MSCSIDSETIERKENEALSEYHDRAYKIFKNTLMDDPKMKFKNIPVQVRELPCEDNKVQGFFHVISEIDKKLKIRMYKDERVKYIPFISKMILDYQKCYSCIEPNCSKIKIWSAPYLGKVLRTKIYFEKYDYIVILEKRKNYYQLITAYVVDRIDRKRDLLKEYEKFKV